MKKIYSILAAALLTTGALLTTACSGDDDAVVDNITLRQGSETTPQTGTETIQFTATLAPKDGATTRAITTGTDASNNEILNVAWAKNEKIAVYYQTGTNPVSYATATANVDEVDDETGVATISAELSGAIDGSTVKFVYPASLANDEGDIDESKLLNNQVGRLNKYTLSISKQFDAATGSGTLSVSAKTAVTTNRISLTNRCCICKFNLGLVNPQQGVNNYVITIAFEGSHSYIINMEEALLSQLYIAMLPETSAACTITAQGYADPSMGTLLSTHMTTISSVTLEAGKFYRSINLTMKQFVTLTPETGAVTLHGDGILTGTGGSNTHVTIADGATVILSDATIPGRVADDANTWWAGITCAGNATIILAGSNYVRGYHCDFPGIQAGPTGTTLTIRGAGQLEARTGMNTTQGYGAGIGGGYNMAVGNIRIEGGTITAAGEFGGAGIGSGYAYDSNASCGDITITGGTVSATGGKGAAGIGSGDKGDASNSCGDITIGSDVTGITATQGHFAQAPIGKGHSGSTCGSITIDGTTEWTAGTATDHFIWAVSTVQDAGSHDVTRWTLTHK